MIRTTHALERQVELQYVLWVRAVAPYKCSIRDAVFHHHVMDLPRPLLKSLALAEYLLDQLQLPLGV